MGDPTRGKDPATNLSAAWLALPLADPEAHLALEDVEQLIIVRLHMPGGRKTTARLMLHQRTALTGRLARDQHDVQLLQEPDRLGGRAREDTRCKCLGDSRGRW